MRSALRRQPRTGSRVFSRKMEKLARECDWEPVRAAGSLISRTTTFTTALQRLPLFPFSQFGSSSLLIAERFCRFSG